MPNFELLQKLLRERIVIIDGAMGTTIRTYGPVSYTHLDVYKRQA